MKERLKEIDVLQGMAMFLVVLGHHWLDFMPPWYRSLHYYLYLFHMPLFIFISGFLIRYSYKGVLNVEGYKKYVWKRVKKFFPMYMLVGILCILLSRDFTTSLQFWNQLLNLLIDPKASPATFLWYIFLLFFYYCIAPIIFSMARKVLFSLSLISFVGYLYPSDVSLFCLDYVSKYTVFFLGGVMVANSYKSCLKFLKKYLLAFIALFVCISLFHFYLDYNCFIEFIMPWLAIPALCGLALILQKSSIIDKVFTYISVHCFSIYLFHLFFVQAIGMLIVKETLDFSTLGYIVYLVLSIFVSILCSSKVYTLINKVLEFHT